MHVRLNLSYVAKITVVLFSISGSAESIKIKLPEYDLN